jgi:hypothetical protein
MDCRTAQRELSGGDALEPAVEQHLEGCDACRRFADDVRAIRTLGETPVETPALLREQTLDLCREILAERATTRSLSFWQRYRRMCDSPRFVAAAAIVSVLILTTITILQINNNGDSGASWLMKLAVIQFGVQNYVAALFLPILLVLKNRFSRRHL